jgi:hypothetical protein
VWELRPDLSEVELTALEADLIPALAPQAAGLSGAVQRQAAIAVIRAMYAEA